MSDNFSISQLQNNNYTFKPETVNNTVSDEDKTKTATVSSEDMAKAAVSTVNTQSDSEILSEIRLNGLAATKSVQQIAQDFHISIQRAQKILDKINNNGSQATEEQSETEEYTIQPEMSNAYSYSMEDISNSETSTIEYSV